MIGRSNLVLAMGLLVVLLGLLRRGFVLVLGMVNGSWMGLGLLGLLGLLLGVLLILGLILGGVVELLGKGVAGVRMVLVWRVGVMFCLLLGGVLLGMLALSVVLRLFVVGVMVLLVIGRKGLG